MSPTPPPGIPPLTPDQRARLPHDDLGPRLDAVIWTLHTLATAFLFLRIYCKVSRRGRLWWDDYILIASWMFLIIAGGITTYTVTLGAGKHIWDIPISNLFKITLPTNVGGTFSILAAVWSKTSFAITLLRITRGWTKVVIWWIIVTMNIAMHMTALLVWIQCSPVQKAWNPLIEGSCFPISRIVEYNMFSAAYSGAMDIVLALLPWKIVWAAQLKRSEKIGVAMAMSMGLFAGIAALVKVTQIPRMESGDIYDGGELIMWSTAEISITIMAASTPILRALLGEKKASKKPPGELPKYRLESTDNFELQSRSTCIIEAGPGGLRIGSNASSSRKEEGPITGHGHIVRTSIVTVQYEDQKSKFADADAKASMSPRESPPKPRLPGIPDTKEESV